jgi:hypothetical protein
LRIVTSIRRIVPVRWRPDQRQSLLVGVPVDEASYQDRKPAGH